MDSHYAQKKLMSLPQPRTRSYQIGPWPPAWPHLLPPCPAHLICELPGPKHTQSLCFCCSLCLQCSSSSYLCASLLPFIQFCAQMVPTPRGHSPTSMNQRASQGTMYSLILFCFSSNISYSFPGIISICLFILYPHFPQTMPDNQEIYVELMNSL